MLLSDLPRTWPTAAAFWLQLRKLRHKTRSNETQNDTISTLFALFPIQKRMKKPQGKLFPMPHKYAEERILGSKRPSFDSTI
ncbi:hypothetical protein NPIL_593731 [Nephila pilipes]|uniref:Uncharacterized protein n=1 Tax=Nephila pilipes TaxID=299642 RepID=A0A8X6NKL8_NEPPI|nr:hypothetical protein NPIL_593731 [Nephila pilipes]